MLEPRLNRPLNFFGEREYLHGRCAALVGVSIIHKRERMPS